jgi:hypothetical protein
MEPIYKNAILDCWELLDPDPQKKKYPTYYTNDDILDDQASLISKLRNILEPVVNSIHKEGQ